MEQKETKNRQQNKPNGGRGGHRENAGRKANTKNRVTIESLLTKLELQTNGKPYEDLLIEDFLHARRESDKNLVLKYHNLIMNKMLYNLHKVETSEGPDALEAKQKAFTDALEQMIKHMENK